MKSFMNFVNYFGNILETFTNDSVSCTCYRVNLIGEHIDYCGYAVCPMAIEQDILVAVALSKHNDIYLTNVDPKYKDFQCSFENVG